MIEHRRGARGISTTVLRAVAAVAAMAGSAVILVGGPVESSGAAGIVPPWNPSVSVPPQVMPACSISPVDDTSAGCIDSVLHNINYARWLEGLGPMVLPSNYAADSVPMQQLIIVDEERGDRGLLKVPGLDPSLNAAALIGAENNADPSIPNGYSQDGWGANFARDYTPLGADFNWMYNDGFGGTNLDCTSPSASQCWGHRDNVLAPLANGPNQTAQIGDGDTASGQYAQIFANETGTPDTDVDIIDPSTLPTPSSSTAPDVVQVLPSSSPLTGAGTPVTIEGNYFGASPQIFFGGVPATNVHVDWNGEVTAAAPADPAGTATDQVVVTVTTSGGSSSSTGVAKVNEFTYAPSGAPTITSITPNSGPDVPSGSVTIHGTNFIPGAVAPIVDFGNVVSLGSMSASSTTITTTIPPSIKPGPVDITVTTSDGTSASTPADVYTYSASGSSTAPSITSGGAATFSSGATNVFTVTTTGTPTVSSITNSAFTGCTPSSLPASITFVYAGGGSATIGGNPQAGDGGVYRLCLVASNGTSPAAHQAFTLTVSAPPTLLQHFQHLRLHPLTLPLRLPARG